MRKPSESSASMSETQMLHLVRRAIRAVQHSLPRALDEEDLVQIGLLACVEGLREYDPNRGVPLSGFLWPRLRGQLIDQAWAHVGWSRNQFRRTVRRMTREGLEVDARSVQSRMSNHTALHAVDSEMVSAEGLHRELPGLPVARYGGSPERLLRMREQRRALRAALQALPSDERSIIEDIYFEERSLGEISERFERSRTWTCRTHHRVLESMRMHPVLQADEALVAGDEYAPGNGGERTAAERVGEHAEAS